MSYGDVGSERCISSIGMGMDMGDLIGMFVMAIGCE